MPQLRRDTEVGQPFWIGKKSTSCHTLYVGDAERTLRTLAGKSAHCAVTSPPYWPLRNYDGHESVEIGREDSIVAYLDKLVRVFTELRRVLRDDGTFWLNIGDSRIGASRGRQNSLPWRLGLAIEESGWILRQDLIWRKPNACPDGSTMNRCTRSHEYLLLFVKRPEYYFDGEAIREESGAVRRSVWDIVPDKLGTLHKAIFPRKLVEPCILAGTSQHGCCPVCLAPWKRVTQKIDGEVIDPANVRSDRDRSFKWSRNGITGSLDGKPAEYRTIGWNSDVKNCCKSNDPIPCTVIDPFVGSGTAMVVASALGRSSIGIELSQDYVVKDAIPRLQAVNVNKE